MTIPPDVIERLAQETCGGPWRPCGTKEPCRSCLARHVLGYMTACEAIKGASKMYRERADRLERALRDMMASHHTPLGVINKVDPRKACREMARRMRRRDSARPETHPPRAQRRGGRMTTSTKAELTLAAALVLAFMLGALVGATLADHLDRTLMAVCSIGRF